MLPINGDLLTTLDYRRLFAYHRKSRAAATVAVCERKTVVDFGVIQLDDSDLVCGYTEKPAYRYLVSMGVNIFDRRAISCIRPGEALGIPDLIGRLRESGKSVAGYRNSAEWLDIGRPEDYQTAQVIFDKPGTRARYIK